MSNPYEDIFNDSEENKNKPSEFQPMDFGSDAFPEDQPEALDEILTNIDAFHKKAEPFSKLLSQTNAISHKVVPRLLSYFVKTEDTQDQKSLKGERKYHELLRQKFTAIIGPMRELAELHLETVEQFNRDIDKHYYSIEKTDRTVKADKAMAVHGINLQRKILAEAANHLEILKGSLEQTERRIKSYINTGRRDNISLSEYAMITQRRAELTSGKVHQFDYAFFNFNLLDKTVNSLGIYMKETTSQYLKTLSAVFEIT